MLRTNKKKKIFWKSVTNGYFPTPWIFADNYKLRFKNSSTILYISAIWNIIGSSQIGQLWKTSLHFLQQVKCLQGKHMYSHSLCRQILQIFKKATSAGSENRFFFNKLQDRIYDIFRFIVSSMIKHWFVLKS